MAGIILMTLKWLKALWLAAISPLPTTFSKGFLMGAVKARYAKLTHSHTMTLLTPLGNKPFENTVIKGEIAHRTFCYFHQI